MPELPEVETTVRGLARFLDGEILARVTLNRADLRRPFPPGLVQALTGARVTGLDRRAKYGLIHTDRDRTMVFHLGMSGRWRIEPDALGKHDHLVLETGSGHRLSLCDPRRFGSVDLVDTAGLAAWSPFAAMGPEPLSSGLTAGHLAKALAGRIAASSPDAIRAAKRLCNLPWDTPDAEVLLAEAREQQVLMRSTNHREALRAAAEGRAPVYRD